MCVCARKTTKGGRLILKIYLSVKLTSIYKLFDQIYANYLKLINYSNSNDELLMSSEEVEGLCGIYEEICGLCS